MTTAVLAALVLLGAGCGPRGCACDRLPKDLLVAQKPKAGVVTDVQMLTAGDAPRSLLRVERGVGHRYHSVIEASGALGLEGSEALIGPVIVTTVEHEVLRGSADPLVLDVDGGALRLIEERAVVESVVVRSEQTAPETLALWNAALKPLSGSTSRVEIAESGAVHAVEQESATTALPKELQRTVEATLENTKHFAFRLPPVPVGVGARWQFREAVDLNGVAARQVAEMRLRSVDSETAVIAIVVRQQAPKQNVPHPFAPGKTAVLNTLRGDAEGEFTVDRVSGILLRGRLVGMARLTLSGELNGVYGTATFLASSVLTARALPTALEAPGAPVENVEAPDAAD